MFIKAVLRVNIGYNTTRQILRNPACIRRRSTSASAALHQDEDPNWVKSQLESVDCVKGFTIPEIIRQNMGGWGKLTAFESHETGRKYSHDQILKNAQGFAAALIQSGLKRCEVVAIVLPNVPEYASILFGIWDAGLVASPVNPSYSFMETKRQLEMSDSVTVVTNEENVASVLKAKDANPKIKSVIVVGEPVSGCHSFYEMVKADTFGIDFYKGSSSDTTQELALLPFSSGTTGPPKGVMLTHSNIVTNLIQCEPSRGISMIRPAKDGFQERNIGLLPFFHAFGSASILCMTMHMGGHSRTLSKFDQNTFLAAIREHKPTILHLVTPLISHIANSDNYGAKELESAHTIAGGAAPIGQALISQLLDKAGKHFLFQEGYGMTELSPVSHVLLPGTNNTKIGSCGSPIPGTITKIIDLEGNSLKRNERGEILVKGPQVMLGYYKNPEATKNTIDSDGWLHTGDIAYYDDEGDMFIVDRLKELIKVQGFQVAPSELEDLLRQNEKVEDVAVIGVSDVQTGEAPRAYIVKKPQVKLTEDEVHHYLKDLVSKHKYLKGGIEFRESIPKAPSGKILRRELSDEYKKKFGS
ncbi:probable 4-coumarate--CoA ligase 3 [Folsomia candida]|uniref:Putative 4-coumarate--CoA ligase 3 n=1 Tax=Folsomia candida TaxID=158441 RepID=A0A226DBX9_FOLCA|nr:probable 4-coumarate--CoA ligase 3 [Folsomia candida]OXA41756.1 putative 4-coumarate--CoA ligase 3 [Folsomia candida]